MKKTISIILLIIIAVNICGCDAFTQPVVTTKPIQEQTPEPTQTPDISEDPKIKDLYYYVLKKSNISTDNEDGEVKQDWQLDYGLWNYVVESDKYYHEFDDYRGNAEKVKKEKDKVIELNKYCDTNYNHNKIFDRYKTGECQGYGEAAEEFYNAIESYSMWMVNYAMFGDSEYKDLLLKAEKTVCDTRQKVVEQRIKFIESCGVNPNTIKYN